LFFCKQPWVFLRQPKPANKKINRHINNLSLQSLPQGLQRNITKPSALFCAYTGLRTAIAGKKCTGQLIGFVNRHFVFLIEIYKFCSDEITFVFVLRPWDCFSFNNVCKPEKMAGHEQACAYKLPPKGGIEGGHHFFLGFLFTFFAKKKSKCLSGMRTIYFLYR